jgi:chromosome segregation ATPase
LKCFASQFSSLEADKARLKEEVQSTSSKLDRAIKMVVVARQNADSLKKELDQLKNKLKEEEKEKSRIPSPKEGKRGSSSQIHLGSTW